MLLVKLTSLGCQYLPKSCQHIRREGWHEQKLYQMYFSGLAREFTGVTSHYSHLWTIYRLHIFRVPTSLGRRWV
jgi:hypothetical protein